jgi:hypothetical protein
LGVNTVSVSIFVSVSVSVAIAFAVTLFIIWSISGFSALPAAFGGLAPGASGGFPSFLLTSHM